MIKIQNLKSKIQTGFTLIESLAVIAIIGVLVSISVLAFKLYQPTFQLSGETRDLVANLRYTQQLAVTEQINHAVCFFSLDGGYENKYEIIKYGECGVSTPQKEKNLEGIKIKQVNFSSPAIIFNPYGAVIESGTVVLENTKNKTKTIEVKPSGFVKISD